MIVTKGQVLLLASREQEQKVMQHLQCMTPFSNLYCTCCVSINSEFHRVIVNCLLLERSDSNKKRNIISYLVFTKMKEQGLFEIFEF